VDLASPLAIDAFTPISNAVSTGLVFVSTRLSAGVRPVFGAFSGAFRKLQVSAGIGGVVGNATCAGNAHQGENQDW